MKKAVSIILTLVLCFALVSCSSGDKLQKYIDKNGEELLESLEDSFAASSGMTCTSDIEVVDNGFVINININELDNIPEETKALLQSTYDAMDGTFNGILEDLQDEIPEVEYMTINVCEKDGDILAVIECE